jgi:pyruvate-ferredoxin/flavodoxin oxidoreductase
MVCPHAVIRQKVYDPQDVNGDIPATFLSTDARFKEFPGMKYTLQVSPEDCTGCALCVEVCPAKSKSEARHKAINMLPQAPLREPEATNWRFFLDLPEPDRALLNPGQVKDVQLLRPLFEFSGACAGCWREPYLKLVTWPVRRPRLSPMPQAVHRSMAAICPYPWTVNARAVDPPGQLAV